MHLFIYLFINLSMYLSIYVFIHLFISVFSYLCIDLFMIFYLSTYIYLFIYIFIYLFMYICIFIFIHLSIHLSMYLLIDWLIYIFIFSFTYLYTHLLRYVCVCTLYSFIFWCISVFSNQKLEASACFLTVLKMWGEELWGMQVRCICGWSKLETVPSEARRVFWPAPQCTVSKSRVPSAQRQHSKPLWICRLSEACPAKKDPSSVGVLGRPYFGLRTISSSTLAMFFQNCLLHFSHISVIAFMSPTRKN